MVKNQDSPCCAPAACSSEIYPGIVRVLCVADADLLSTTAARKFSLVPPAYCTPLSKRWQRCPRRSFGRVEHTTTAHSSAPRPPGTRIGGSAASLSPSYSPCGPPNALRPPRWCQAICYRRALLMHAAHRSSLTAVATSQRDCPRPYRPADAAWPLPLCQRPPSRWRKRCLSIELVPPEQRRQQLRGDVRNLGSRASPE